MREFDATAYLPPARGRVRRPVVLHLTDDSYAPEPTPEDAWLTTAFRAFARIAERRAARDVLIVGTGNGLDALGAAELFPLATLAVTDLYEASLAVSRRNVLAHLEAPPPQVTFHAGDLLAGVPPGRRFDLVYENLPNLPAADGVDLRPGVHTGRFFAGGDDVPEPFGSHLLALHHRLLRDVRPQVRRGGGVLTAIGGRIPLDVAFDLHRACGYVPELVAYDVKRQIEPGLVLPPYARAEADGGVTFTYYAAPAIDVVTAARRQGLDGQELHDAVAVDLAPLALTATEAERRSRAGEPIAHAVLMVLGTVPEGSREAHETVT